MAKPPFEPSSLPSTFLHLSPGICPPAKQLSVKTHQTITTLSLPAEHALWLPATRKCHQLGSRRKGQRVESHVSHFKGTCLLPSVGLRRFFTLCMFLEMFCIKRHILHICWVSVGQTETLWSHFLASSERCGFLLVIMIRGCLSQKTM